MIIKKPVSDWPHVIKVIYNQGARSEGAHCCCALQRRQHEVDFRSFAGEGGIQRRP